MKTFREGVAKWYFALRNLSIVVSLAVLIYMGIRMAISSVASDKAKYKEMLKDWLIGFAVLFFLHYFMIIILNLNNQLVDLIYVFNKASSSSIMGDYTSSLVLNAFNISFIKGWGSLIIYFMLLGTTIALFIMYMKRLFTVGFLIVISPLITITYAIDKMGDGKSQALDTWMKEFTYNILIQPFHCIIYTVFVGTAVSTLGSNASLAYLVFAILSVLFIFKAEDIVKTIFGVSKASSVGGMVAAGALAGSALSKLGSGAGKAKKAIGKVETGNKGKSEIKRKQIPANTKSTNTKTSTATNTSTTNNTSTTSTSNNTSKQSRFDKIKNSNFGKAVSDFAGEKMDAFRDFKANPAGALKSGAKQMAIRQLAAATKLGPKLMVGAMVAGATGNGFNGIITGYAVPGGRFTRKISSALDSKANDIDIDGKQTQKLAAAYEGFRMANSNLSDEELYNKSADLLESNIDELTDKNEIELAKQLQGIQERYRLNGEEKPAKKAMKKIEDIQLGNIDNNVVSISLDSVKVASQKMKTGNSNLTNDDIIQKSKELIKDMQNSKGSYLRSEEYKNLDAETKKLAKEVHKSKKVLTAIGNVSDDVVNEEIVKAIESGLDNS